jgi:hypothetical protein
MNRIRPVYVLMLYSTIPQNQRVQRVPSSSAEVIEVLAEPQKALHQAR